MSDSKLTPPKGKAPMSVRECRLILERLLVAAAVPAGAVLALREALLDAELGGLRLLELLHREPSLLDAAAVKPLRSEGSNGELHIDAGGQFSLFAAPAILDLIAEHCAVEGVCRLRVTGLEQPALLDSLAVSGRRRGFEVTARIDSETTAVLHAQPTGVQDDRELESALRDGITVDGEVWLDLYLRSNHALVPDSRATRAHAGHLDVDEHGRIVKPMDDDVDVEHALARMIGNRSAGGSG
jgi:hypothetical protein